MNPSHHYVGCIKVGFTVAVDPNSQFVFELHSNVNRTLFEPKCHILILFKVQEICQMEWMVPFGICKFRVKNRTELNFSITMGWAKMFYNMIYPGPLQLGSAGI